MLVLCFVLVLFLSSDQATSTFGRTAAEAEPQQNNGKEGMEEQLLCGAYVHVDEWM